MDLIIKDDNTFLFRTAIRGRVVEDLCSSIDNYEAIEELYPSIGDSSVGIIFDIADDNSEYNEILVIPSNTLDDANQLLHDLVYFGSNALAYNLVNKDNCLLLDTDFFDKDCVLHELSAKLHRDIIA